MIGRQISTQRKIKNTKRDFYQQEFYIHHPLLDRIIEAKLQKCLQYGQVRDFFATASHLAKRQNALIVQAPCVLGNSKRLEIKSVRPRKIVSGCQLVFSRPKSVIRSRTTEPRVRQKLKYLARQDEQEQNLKPALSIRRFVENKV